MCRHKSFWRGTKCCQNFGLAQKIWTGTKYIWTCKSTKQKIPKYICFFNFQDSFGSSPSWLGSVLCHRSGSCRKRNFYQVNLLFWLQIILCQINAIFRQSTQNMTTDCSLNYMFRTYYFTSSNCKQIVLTIPCKDLNKVIIFQKAFSTGDWKTLVWYSLWWLESSYRSSKAGTTSYGWWNVLGSLYNSYIWR